MLSLDAGFHVMIFRFTVGTLFCGRDLIPGLIEDLSTRVKS